MVFSPRQPGSNQRHTGQRIQEEHERQRRPPLFQSHSAVGLRKWAFYLLPVIRKQLVGRAVVFDFFSLWESTHDK